jgi:HKD family nuclease
MEVMNQPFSGQLGNRLIELLESSDYHTLDIAVAFAKNSGVLRIKDSLKKFREEGGKINVYVGVDLGGTSYEALTALLLHTDSLNVVHSEGSQTFHSKIYHFSGAKSGFLVVGSHNLTAGGLWTNFESSVHIPTDGAIANGFAVHKETSVYFKELTSLKGSFMSITTQEEIDTLLQEGYVTKEVANSVWSTSTTKRSGTGPRLFGNGTPAKLPRLTPSKAKNQAAVSANPTGSLTFAASAKKKTIWFETRRMTGGSRNILDLSKRSLVERGDPTGTPFDLGEPNFMRGGVEFFGLDSTDTTKSKSIMINFEGVDYDGNTILFPEGDNANGSWRLQIKGASSSNTKITEAFRARANDYLVQKVITFTEVQADYYFMSVFLEADLESFKTASSILARNGPNRSAKFLGLL